VGKTWTIKRNLDHVRVLLNLSHNQIESEQRMRMSNASNFSPKTKQNKEEEATTKEHQKQSLRCNCGFVGVETTKNEFERRLSLVFCKQRQRMTRSLFAPQCVNATYKRCTSDTKRSTQITTNNNNNKKKNKDFKNHIKFNSPLA
jgi:hypothetical protein